AGSGRTTSTSSKAWTVWRPTTGTSISPTSTPACRSTTSAIPTTRTSPGTSSPMTPRNAAAQYRRSSSTRPRTSLSTVAALPTCPKETAASMSPATRPAGKPPPTTPHGAEETLLSITISTSVEIDAPKQLVWDVLTDFSAYREWNPYMEIEGILRVGT